MLTVRDLYNVQLGWTLDMAPVDALEINTARERKKEKGRERRENVSRL